MASERHKTGPRMITRQPALLVVPKSEFTGLPLRIVSAPGPDVVPSRPRSPHPEAREDALGRLPGLWREDASGRRPGPRREVVWIAKGTGSQVGGPGWAVTRAQPRRAMLQDAGLQVRPGTAMTLVGSRARSRPMGLRPGDAYKFLETVVTGASQTLVSDAAELDEFLAERERHPYWRAPPVDPLIPRRIPQN